VITAEQRAARLLGVGGSDAAAILGVSPWKTALDVYGEKVGAKQEELDAGQVLRMDLGNDMEAAILRRWAHLEGKAIVESPPSVAHPKHPWMLGNVDALVVGERAGVEAKLITSFDQAARLGEEGTDEGLAEHVVQSHHYLEVCDLERWYLVYYDSRKGLRTYVVQRDRDLGAAMVEAEGEFWQRVVRRDPPSAEASERGRAALARIYPREEHGLIAGDAAQVELALAYAAAARAEKSATQAKEAAAALLCEAIGPFSGFEWAGGKATWKANKRGTPAWKALAKHLGATPEQIEQFTPPGSRVLRVKTQDGETE
jgi:putative phage-type endonuclease